MPRAQRANNQIPEVFGALHSRGPSLPARIRALGDHPVRIPFREPVKPITFPPFPPNGGRRSVVSLRRLGVQAVLVGGVSMGRRFLEGTEDPWEYADQTSVYQWAQQHVMLAVVAGALVWFAAVYMMTVVIDLFT